MELDKSKEMFEQELERMLQGFKKEDATCSLECFTEFNEIHKRAQALEVEAREVMKKNGFTDWLTKNSAEDPLLTFLTIGTCMHHSMDRAYLLRKLRPNALDQLAKEKTKCKECGEKLTEDSACCSKIWVVDSNLSHFHSGYCKNCCPEHKDKNNEALPE